MRTKTSRAADHQIDASRLRICALGALRSKPPLAVVAECLPAMLLSEWVYSVPADVIRGRFSSDAPLTRIIDAWMQQLSPRHLADPMFASLRRWTAKTPFPSEITPEITIASMDAGNVAVGLSAAWCGPHGWMISHEEVAAVASAHPERILGVASADLSRPRWMQSANYAVS